mmetsp:Transcript_61933/g.69363  ORF Transcript_61933/g.69363 Transcript_61933/m.69363 type:complete len:92 (-) Transcript_61933:165-440(-)
MMHEYCIVARRRTSTRTTPYTVVLDAKISATEGRVEIDTIQHGRFKRTNRQQRMNHPQEQEQERSEKYKRRFYCCLLEEKVPEQHNTNTRY